MLKTVKDSRIAGFYRMSIAERIDALAEREWIDTATAVRLKTHAVLLEGDVANRMIENVIGVFGLPLAVAPNFKVNDRDRVVPMAVEEPSIVAGISRAARLVRESGGFRVSASEQLLIGQIMLVDVGNPDAAMRALEAARAELLALANTGQPRLVARGGGAREIELRRHDLPGDRPVIALHLLVDTRDAMGANVVNSMCESIAPSVEQRVAGRAVLKILSNLADRSLVTATAVVPLAALGSRRCPPEAIRDDIVLANELALTDPYRAATHNKGIMNGVDALAVATGNDWRSLEAAAHAYAVRDGSYRALTRWSVDPAGNLAGELAMPIRVGTVGGALRSNPAAVLGLAIAGVQTSMELAELMGAVGLAQNLAALRALVTEGIQAGHMRLHARSVAASVGTPPEQFESVVDGMIASGDIKDWKARELLAETRRKAGVSSVAATAAKPQGSAAGKVILLGEHAAVYDRHALALPIERAAAVSLREVADTTRFVVSEPGRTQEILVADTSTEGAAGILAFIIRELGFTGRHFDVHLQLRIPAAMGLGSSAAASVAIARAFDAVFSLGFDDHEVNRIAFECEKLAHGNPSGIDNTLATCGRPLLFRRSASPPVRQITLSEDPPLVIACSGVRGITRDQVAAVRGRFEALPGRYEALFDEMDALTLAGAQALVEGDYATLGSLMNICHGLLNALQVSTPGLERMVHIARLHGAAGAKLTGGGGGGSIVALCPGSISRVAAALRDAGYRIIEMREGQS